MVAAIVALTVVLFAGCGGGADDRAKIETNLQHYLVSLAPGEGPFPNRRRVPAGKGQRLLQA